MEKKGSKQLYNKLFFIYTAVMICVLLAVMGYFFNSLRQKYSERNMEYMQKMHEEAVQYMESCGDIADYLHEELYKSDMEMQDLIHYLTDNSEAYQRYRLDTFSQYHLMDYNGIEDFSKTSFDAYSNLKLMTFVSYSKGDLTSYDDSENVYHTEDGQIALDRIQDGNMADPGEFSFLKEIRDPVTMQNLGAMIVTFDTDRFQTIQDYYELPRLMVYNESGTVIYDEKQEYEVSDIERERLNGSLEDKLRSFIMSTNLKENYIIAYLKKSEAAAVPVTMIMMIVGVALVVFLIGEILVNYYLKRLSGRLKSILDGMTQVMSGNLSARIETDRNGDELDVIARHFNEMCEKLDTHIQKSYLAEIEQKNAEMAALQSQINPHFLYNTLEAIRMKAICNGDREVGKMLYSMAVTFRSQLKEADIITLAQELHYCKKYLELFEYRYPNQFSSSVECPLEYMKVPIIKFVLQPIIENYFIHGIRLSEKDNCIKIRVEKQGEDFELIVEDNGRGMSESEIEQKNIQLEKNEWTKSGSIGVSNVNRRIKAVYGSSYGVRMEEIAAGGVRVIVRFHPDKVEEGESNEKCNDR